MPARIFIDGEHGTTGLQILARGERLEEGEHVVVSANFLIDSESKLKAALAGMGSKDEATSAPPGHAH